MIVYSATRREFTDDVHSNRIEERILDAFTTRLRRSVGPGEIAAWKNSMQYMNNVLVGGEIDEDAGVAIEYTIPQTAKRIDFILTGKGEAGQDTAVIVELKQWSEATATDKDALVETFINGAIREVTHPSYQAWTYAQFIADFNEAVQEGRIALVPCAYLHNLTDSTAILDESYAEHTERAPVFAKADAHRLQQFIKRYVRQGDRDRILYRIERGLSSDIQTFALRRHLPLRTRFCEFFP